LNALKLRNDMAEVIACPTCARTEFDVMGIAEQTEKLVRGIKKPLKIAVMGCVVNGIGEGRDADFGIAGGKEKSVLFVKGQKVKTVENDKIIDTIKETLEGFIKNE
ncbi:MAG: flavodoxin-dependent (E)-4-hydroxy-3-methylbut-2-enyl-diphosphate synthase, partial [Clostridiales bacterium]|nr:flavodoxin-dependent (E)-4-hydroxy-3-methylbut-2-enyl-diphosphate synthase [Clostridiales bacterium]